MKAVSEKVTKLTKWLVNSSYELAIRVYFVSNMISFYINSKVNQGRDIYQNT